MPYHVYFLPKLQQVADGYPELCRRVRFRTVTLGLNLLDCVDGDFDRMKRNIETDIVRTLQVFSAVTHEVLGTVAKTLRAKVQATPRRVVTTPLELLVRSGVSQARRGGASEEQVIGRIVDLARFIEGLVHRELHQPFEIAGLGYLAEKGINRKREIYFDSLPRLLAETSRYHVNVSIGSPGTGIDIESLGLVARTLARIACGDAATASGSGCAAMRRRLPPAERRLFDEAEERVLAREPGVRCVPFRSALPRVTVSFGAPEDNPFVSGFHGPREPEISISLGVAGAGIVQGAIAAARGEDLTDVARAIKHVCAMLFDVAESVRYRIAAGMRSYGQDVDDKDGVVDLALAGGPERDGRSGRPVNSVVPALGGLGLAPGSPGMLAGLGLVRDAVRRAGAGKVSYQGGLGGLLLPLLEDAGMQDAVADGSLSVDRLIALGAVATSVLDLVPIGVPAPFEAGRVAQVLGGLLLDAAAVGLYASGTTVSRILPVPLPSRCDVRAVFLDAGRVVGVAPVLPPCAGGEVGCAGFFERLGRLPAPIAIPSGR